MSVVTLPSQDNNKLLDQLKTRFKRTIKWNKYRLEMTNQPKTINLNYLVSPTLSKVNKLFVLSFRINEDGNKGDRISFSEYYLPAVGIKYFNVLIDWKGSFDVLIKNKEKTYDKVIEMSKNEDCTIDNLLDHGYFSRRYKSVAINLSKQIELENAYLKQEINFIGKLEEDNGATMFFIIEFQFFTTFCKYCIKWKHEKPNLLNDSSNEESKFPTKRWFVLILSLFNSITFQIERINQVFFIILMHLF